MTSSLDFTSKSSRSAVSRRFAAIDIGTVTCRMLIADVDEFGLHELRREYAITDLGEGVAASATLLPAAMARVDVQMARFMAVVAEFTTIDHPLVTVIALATSAARDASNADEFVKLLAARNIALTVIPGEREAALSFRGASCDFAGEDLLVVDIGGGSTEIIAGTAGCDPLFKHSFNVGCRRVTEQFLASDPPTASELKRARCWIEREMRAVFSAVDALRFEPARLVAVAGTATSVVAIDCAMRHYDSARVHQRVVARATLDRIADDLASMCLSRRRQVVGLDPGRAAVMVAGLLILQVVLDFTGQDAFTVSESDILQGIILDTAHA
ncbi:MAG: Ppx/GppA family phosphatase [Raoultibacter sp.]